MLWDLLFGTTSFPCGRYGSGFLFDAGSITGGSLASGSMDLQDYTGSIDPASTLDGGSLVRRGGASSGVVCIPVYDSGHVTSPGAIGCGGELFPPPPHTYRLGVRLFPGGGGLPWLGCG